MATVGTIEVVASIDTGKYKRGAKEIEQSNKDITGSSESSGSSLERLNKRLTGLAKGGLKIAAVGMAGLATAVAAMTIKGGIDRALNIEDAQAKLKGLGHDAQSVEEIMVSALDSVRGTAYGLDAAATIAASAVAAGVKPGQDLTKYLGTTADAATIAGVSLSEMGSIFNKVQTQQRAYTMELNQLADRGIPIYQWLQEELGVTQEALREMVAAGEVDAETYFKVVQKNIGGAALESGKTTRGAWANMLAAMSRVGARIVSGPIDTIRGGFGDMTKWIDDNADRIVYAVQDTLDVLVKLGRGAVAVGRFIYDMRVPIITVTAAWAGYRLAVIASNAAMAIQSALMYAAGTRMLVYNGAIITVRGAVTAATVAQTAWNLALNLNPIGLVIGAVAGLTAALALLANGTNRMTTEERYLNETREKSIEISNRAKQAEDDLKTSRDDMKRAGFDVKRAEEALALAVQTYGEESWQAEEATLNLEVAKDRMRQAKDKNVKATQELTQAQKDQRDMIDGIIQKLDSLNGKSVRYTMNGTNMVASRQSDGNTYLMPEFNTGGFTGRGGYNEEAGIVHKGEFVIPKRMVNQATGLPKEGVLGSTQAMPSAPNITINLSGTFATSKQEQRNVAELISTRLQEVQRSRAINGGTP